MTYTLLLKMVQSDGFHNHSTQLTMAKTSKKCYWESQNVKVVCPNDKLEFYPFSSLVSALYKETVSRQVSSKTAEKKMALF